MTVRSYGARVCPECGETFEARGPTALRCSEKCRQGAEYRRQVESGYRAKRQADPGVRARKLASNRGRQSFPCVACGAPVERSRGSRYSGVALCGDYRSGEPSLCRSFHRTGAWPASPVTWATEVPTDHPCRQCECRGCAAPFVRLWLGQLYCTPQCSDRAGYRRHYSAEREAEKWRRRMAKVRTVLPLDHPVRQDRCADCGEPFTRLYAGQLYCSVQCQRRTWRTRRDMLLLGAYVEDVPRFRVFERDGWRCHLCRKSIPRSAAYPDPRSASLDHVVPLSLGGEHSMANVRAAHLRCNLSKGVQARGEQLAMI